MYTVKLKDEYSEYFLNRFICNRGYRPVFAEGIDNALLVTREEAEAVAEQVGYEDCSIIEVKGGTI